MKEKNILKKAGVFAIMLCLTCGFFMNTTIKSFDKEIKETFVEEIEFYPPPMGAINIPPWDKTYILDVEKYNYVEFYSVSATNDGNFICSGIAQRDDPFRNDDALIVKINPYGDVLFYNNFGGNEADWAFHAEQTSDGGYIITGCTMSYGAAGHDVFLIKTDVEGNEEWNKTFGGPLSKWDMGRCVRETENGYIIIGYVDHYSNDEGDCWVIKTDLQGNLVWDKTYTIEPPDPIPIWEWGMSIQQTDDNGYVFTIGALWIPYHGPVELIKIDPLGNIEWNTTVWEWGLIQGSESLQITSDNSYIICGGNLSIFDKYTFNNNAVITKVNSDGMVLWEKQLVSHAYYGDIRSVKQTSDGGYITVGEHRKLNEDWGLWLVKFDSDGNYKWGKVWNEPDNREFGESVELYSNGDYLLTGHKKAYYSGSRTCGWCIHERKITESAPNQPEPPSGPSSVKKNRVYKYTVSTTDPEGDDIRYCIHWGETGDDDPTLYDWSDWVASGEEWTFSHSWDENGKYFISVMAIDESNLESEWSEPWETSVKVSGCFAGTQITMATGTPVTVKSIETLQVGDLISSYNPITQEITIAEVIEVFEYTVDLPEQLIFNNILEVTSAQTLYINGEGWIEAKDTVLYDLMLENIPGTFDLYPVPIISREPTSLGGSFYELEIRPIIGEAVGYWANGILVGG